MTAPFGATDPTSVVGRRVVAYLIDVTVMLALLLVPILSNAVSFSERPFIGYSPSGIYTVEEATGLDELTVATGSGTTTFSADDTIYIDEDGSGMIMSGDDIAMGVLLYLGVGLLMFVLLQGITGATLGKLLTGIRVVKSDGQAPGIGRAFLRSIMWIVDIIPLCIPGLVGFIAASASKGHRRVGDMVANTFVVRAGDTGQPVLVPGLTASVTPPGGWAAPASAYATTSTPPIAPPPAAASTIGDLEAGGYAAATSSTATAATPDASQPTWDPQRNAYIAWDADEQQWKQFDDATQAWTPIT